MRKFVDWSHFVFTRPVLQSTFTSQAGNPGVAMGCSAGDVDGNYRQAGLIDVVIAPATFMFALITAVQLLVITAYRTCGPRVFDLPFFENELARKLKKLFDALRELLYGAAERCSPDSWAWLISLDENSVSQAHQTYLTQPYFVYFGLLFFLTTICSLIGMMYTGLYGTFMLNLVTLVALWLSTLPYVEPMFSFNAYYYMSFGKWMYLTTDYKVSFDLFIDIVSMSFSFLTLTMAVFVYIYTFSYFRYEPLVDSLILFLNAFMMSMAFLVSAGNFMVLFLGWELMGLTSFFLINFWSASIGTLKAAFKAYSFNKASDLFLFVVIILMFNTTYTLDMPTFLSEVHLYENYRVSLFFVSVSYLEMVSVLFLICAFIKSAQFGAHIWLPDSMEAPVPASALIHSATLVSAGIYLLMSFTVLFELSYLSTSIVSVVGAVTAFYGGFTSMFQSDAKSVLAYSTISHCGFLMVIYSLGVPEYTILYLYVHGFFKAATFLSVGNVMRLSRNTQDFKRMGMYYKLLPFDCVMSFVCLMNLSGLPLTFGFFIKHLLFVGLKLSTPLYYFVLVNCVFGALTGLFYGSRLFYSVFFDFKKASKSVYNMANSSVLKSTYYINTSRASTMAMVGLVLVSYFFSVFLLNLFIGKGSAYSDFSNYSLSALSMDAYWSSKNFLMNNSLLNWIAMALTVMMFFTPWSKTAVGALHYFTALALYMFAMLFFLLYSQVL